MLVEDLRTRSAPSSTAAILTSSEGPAPCGAFVVPRLSRRVAVRSRDRRARRPPDPGRAVRRRRGGRARRVVRRARARLVAAEARAAAASGRCSASRSSVEVAARRARRVRLRRHRLRRPGRHRQPERQPRADGGLRRLLGRRPVRRRCCSATCSGCSARGGRSAARPAGSPRGSRAARCRSRSPYPERLGHWPAAAGLFAFAICELCWAAAKRPGAARGADARLPRDARRDEPLRRRAVDAPRRRVRRLVRRCSPGSRRSAGAATGGSSCAPPVVGATALAAVAGTIALLLIAVGSTAFDGAKEGPLFNDLIGDLQDALQRPRALARARARARRSSSGSRSRSRSSTAIWALGVLGHAASRASGSRGASSAARFAHTLIPIAAAYLVAHYFSLLAYNGQDLWPLAIDPLGDGSDLFGGAGDGDRLPVVVGDRHLVRPGRRARRRPRRRARAGPRPRARALRRPRAATRSQIVMLVLMVAFTVLGLWLLSAALNT